MQTALETATDDVLRGLSAMPAAITTSVATLLGDASEMLHTLGEPSVSVEQMVAWVGAWVQEGGRSLGKPTKFESREGKF